MNSDNRMQSYFILILSSPVFLSMFHDCSKYCNAKHSNKEKSSNIGWKITISLFLDFGNGSFIPQSEMVKVFPFLRISVYFGLRRRKSMILKEDLGGILKMAFFPEERFFAWMQVRCSRRWTVMKDLQIKKIYMLFI